MKYYIAYGSNMNLEQMALRCPTAKVVGTAELKGWRLRFNNVATIEQESGGRTPVVVWTIEDADERALDRYEGYPTLYYKKTLTVDLNGEPVTAMVYIMTGGDEREPGGYYYRVIEDGYRSAGLNTRPLIAACRRARDAETDRRKLLLKRWGTGRF